MQEIAEGHNTADARREGHDTQTLVVDRLPHDRGSRGSVLGDDHDHEPHDNAGCFLLSEVEPNATVLTAQFLGDLFVADCVAVAGSLFDPADVDSYASLSRNRSPSL